ncbi:hypothetical protein PISL3812_03208 [Talaromyces islandicus]|uniref:F-box domain-containing protein n=1 Tax=Talaromyces islandicus TaxID=28573 RepID=A0A0U1LSF2_TALIS|nr:hypothetical protein PISL3812_03208 [Talaromyces islandicus]
MPSLLTLPLELLVAISTYLSTKDLGFLRLTCKRVEKSLYSWFAEEFFTKKQFMLTHKSLQTLIDISRHESLSKHVTHVILATNIYPAVLYTFRDADAAASWTQGFYDQQALMSTGYDQDMLTEAFEKLDNLQVVGIRDFNSNNRRRDGTNASWSSWGAPTVLQETGIELQFASDRFSNTTTSFLAHIFQTLICALARAGRKPPNIEVFLRKELLPDIAFHFPSFLTPSVTPILQNLETLLISTDRIPTHALRHGIGADGKDGPFLRQFLGQTHNLRHLRINFNKFARLHTDSFLEWLGQPAVATGAAPIRILDPPPIALTNLEQLELGQMTVGPVCLLRVIDKFASTLKDFCLWRTNLVNHPDDARSAAKSTITADFLKSLSCMRQLVLTHFKLGFLQQDGHFTNFKTQDLKDAPCDKTREYTGEKMGHFIQELINDIVIDEPRSYYSDHSDDGSNDDDNEDLEMLDEEGGDSENDDE